MTVSFTEGRQNDAVFLRIEGLDKLTKRGIRQARFKIGHGLIGAASREILKGPKTGIVYIRRDKIGRRRRHVSSAPGETHANRSGTLRKSLSFQLRGSHAMEFGYGVSSAKTAPDYDGWVEFGTTKMKPRPSLFNAIRSEQGNTLQHFQKEIDKELG